MIEVLIKFVWPFSVFVKIDILEVYFHKGFNMNQAGEWQGEAEIAGGNLCTCPAQFV
jgi:hypothetical protein